MHPTLNSGITELLKTDTHPAWGGAALSLWSRLMADRLSMNRYFFRSVYLKFDYQAQRQIMEARKVANQYFFLTFTKHLIKLRDTSYP